MDARSFGDLLKDYRKRKRLTQRHLAAKLGIHYNTIYRWEQGDFLPETRGIVLELAKQLDLNDQETHQLLEASLLYFSSYWTIPAQRNPLFTGREQVLRELRILLQRHQSVTLTQAYSLSGLGGVGKTQIALEYAYRHAKDYHALFWINAETQESLLASLGAIAAALHLPQYTDQHHLVAAVKQWLTTHRDWLLIVDNVEYPELIKPILPTAPHGCFLYTTRLPSLWDLAQTLEVEPLTQEESVQFLLHHNNSLPTKSVLPSEEDEQAANALAVALGGLPLALDQARAYIEYTKCRLSDFLTLFERAPLQLLQEREPYADHPLSVTKTFLLTFQKLQREQYAAAELLICCCFLAPEEIPEALLTSYAQLLPPSLQAVVTDPFLFNQAIKSLLSYALIQRRPHRKTIVVHRLLQAVLRAHLSTQQQQAWSLLLIRLLNQAFPDNQKSVEVWPWCDQLLPHVLHSIGQTEAWITFSPDLCALLTRTAAYLTLRAQFTMAEPLFQRALTLLEQAQGPACLDLAPILTEMAQLYRQQGKYDAAEHCFRRALTLLETNQNADLLALASARLGLATLWWDLGRLQDAEPLFRQGIQMREQLQGSMHPDLAIPLNNFANLFYSEGKYADADALYRRSLHILEETRGPDHPDTALPLTNLGMLYIAQERHEEAEPLLLRALQIRERSLGSAHLSNALTLNNLSLVYLERGQYAEAEEVLFRALSIQEQTLGSTHLHLYPPLNNLAEVCLKQGKDKEAEAYYLRALNILERISGLTGCEMIDSLKGLAEVYNTQGHYEKAEAYYQRALTLMMQTSRTRRADLAGVLQSLAALYVKQERYEEAETHYQRALQVWEEHTHEYHTARIQCFKQYASFLRLQCREQEAAQYERMYR